MISNGKILIWNSRDLNNETVDIGKRREEEENIDPRPMLVNVDK